MRVGIDCRMAGVRHAGIGRYVAALVSRVIELDKNVEWVLFFSDFGQLKSVLPNKLPKNVKVVLTPIKHYSVAEQLKLPFVFYKENLDLLHVPHFNAPALYLKKTVLTIHDLLWHHHRGSEVTTLPGWQYWVKYLFYRLVSSLAIYKSEVIFVPSKAVKKTVVNYYPSAKLKIKVAYEGFDHKFKLSPTKTFNKNQLIYLGSLYPHKNIKVVLELLAQNNNYQLKIIGSRNHFQDQVGELVDKLNIKNQVMFLGFLRDDQLIEELRSSLCLVFPSLSEGFGLPGIEAMAAGTPVVASDIPVFKEIYQDAALYFDPYDPADLLKKINSLDSKKRTELHHNAKSLISKYSWDKMTKKILDTYYETATK